MTTQCPVTGKNQYATEEDAHWAIRQHWLDDPHIPKLFVYFCLQCQTYHLTSKLNKKKK